MFVREAVINLTRNIERPFNIHAWRRGKRIEDVGVTGAVGGVGSDGPCRTRHSAHDRPTAGSSGVSGNEAAG